MLQTQISETGSAPSEIAYERCDVGCGVFFWPLKLPGRYGRSFVNHYVLSPPWIIQSVCCTKVMRLHPLTKLRFVGGGDMGRGLNIYSIDTRRDKPAGCTFIFYRFFYPLINISPIVLGLIIFIAISRSSRLLRERIFFIENISRNWKESGIKKDFYFDSMILFVNKAPQSRPKVICVEKKLLVQYV